MNECSKGGLNFFDSKLYLQNELDATSVDLLHLFPIVSSLLAVRIYDLCKRYKIIILIFYYNCIY